MKINYLKKKNNFGFDCRQTNYLTVNRKEKTSMVMQVYFNLPRV